MIHFICKTCGVQQAATSQPPAICPICADERQYVPESGQVWTTLDELKVNHRNVITEVEPNLFGIGTEPKVAIGQRALLVKSAEGNILWDCTPLVTDEAVAQINALGGISAIALSHSHFLSSIVEWSDAFGGIPIYIHAADRDWVQRASPHIVFWEGASHQLQNNITLIQCGGHFPGSSVLHWADGANGNGALLTGDTVYVVPDRRYVTFMYSFPNMIPLNASAVQQIGERLKPYQFDRIYAAWSGAVLKSGGKQAVERSIIRYVAALKEEA